jgi:hypothetical protein
LSGRCNYYYYPISVNLITAYMRTESRREGAGGAQLDMEFVPCKVTPPIRRRRGATAQDGSANRWMVGVISATRRKYGVPRY